MGKAVIFSLLSLPRNNRAIIGLIFTDYVDQQCKEVDFGPDRID